MVLLRNSDPHIKMVAQQMPQRLRSNLRTFIRFSPSTMRNIAMQYDDTPNPWLTNDWAIWAPLVPVAFHIGTNHYAEQTGNELYLLVLYGVAEALNPLYLFPLLWGSLFLRVFLCSHSCRRFSKTEKLCVCPWLSELPPLACSLWCGISVELFQ